MLEDASDFGSEAVLEAIFVQSLALLQCLNLMLQLVLPSVNLLEVVL